MKISQEEPAALQEIGYLDNIESRKVYYGLSMLKSIPPPTPPPLYTLNIILNGNKTIWKKKWNLLEFLLLNPIHWSYEYLAGSSFFYLPKKILFQHNVPAKL